MSKDYQFDEDLRFRKPRLPILKILSTLLKYILVTASLSVLLYLLLSLFISTDTEKKLRRENEEFARLYPDLGPREDLLKDVIAGLQAKDNTIYERIFHSDAPPVDPLASLDILFGNDTIPDSRLVRYVGVKADSLMAKEHRIEEMMRRIASAMTAEGFTPPPMRLPLQDITYPQLGASTGNKINPFLKAYVQHNGLDLIVSQETPVYATGDGVVSNVVRSFRGSGNVVEITHGGGYVTRYAHLSATLVQKGQKVVAGKRIGSVGMTGNSLVPHLHYEVLKDGEYQDPLGYIFASVGPEEYANMLFMAANTEQSLD